MILGPIQIFHPKCLVSPSRLCYLQSPRVLPAFQMEFKEQQVM